MAELVEIIEAKDEFKIIQWLQDSNVIHKSRKCHRCQTLMVLQARNDLVN